MSGSKSLLGSSSDYYYSVFFVGSAQLYSIFSGTEITNGTRCYSRRLHCVACDVYFIIITRSDLADERFNSQSAKEVFEDCEDDFSLFGHHIYLRVVHFC